jgi:hypothetical protein
MKRIVSPGLVLLLFFAAFASSLLGQGQGTGSIEGVVADSSGGVMPGIEVSIRNLGTNGTRTAITDDRGHFIADLLTPGDYEVSASQVGFATAKVAVRLVVGTVARADLKLQVAGQQQTVLVSGESLPIEPGRTEISNTVGERAVENLPINGRRWENFVLLTPGVTNDGDFGLVSYRGISGLYNNNSIDGADNNQAFFSEARGRTRISYTISQAAVMEFQVGLSNYSAEFGRAAGGTVNAVTKSGTNEVHGEGFYFLRDQSFLANDARAKSLGQARPPERRQQFGGSFGGPLKKDKLFFFGNYDQQKRNFPGFVFPNVAFNSVSCTAPGCASTLAFLNTLTGEFPRTGSNYVFLTKVDWLISEKNTLTGSYNFQKWNSPNGIQTQTIITVSPSANGSDGVRTDMLNLKLTSVLTSKTVNEARFQYGRDFEFQFPNSPGPSVSFTNGVSYGMPNFLPRAAYPNEKRFQWTDNLSFMKGNHSFKVGVDINYVRENQINLFNGGGVYSYTGLNALAQDCPAQASGCVPQSTGATTGKHYSSFQQAFDLTGQGGKLFFPTTDTAVYFQDNYRVLPTLTLYLGLRYEYTKLPEPLNGGNTAFPLTTSFNSDTNNFGPRFGFSWDIGGDHKTVLRGGYGLYYGRTSNSAVANALLNNGLVNAGFFMTPSSAGSPVFPNVLSASPAAGASSATINFFSPDYVRPLIHSADLVLERELWNGFTVSASYLMSRGQHLPLFRDANLPTPTGTVTYVLPDSSTAGVFPLYLGPRPNTSIGAEIMSESVLNSYYNGFVLVLTQRFRHGVQVTSNLTISKALDNGQTSTTFFASFGGAYDPLNQALEKGLSTFDTRKRSVTNFILSPSVDKYISSRAGRAVFNDWQLSGILTFQDGRPQTATISGSLASAIGATNSSSTNGTGGSFRVPWLAPGSFTGTGIETVDLRLIRNFRITEGKKIQFLIEAFNLLNNVNFTSFQTTEYRVASSTKSGSNATVTLAAFSTTPFLLPINTSNTLYTARQMQLGLKFIF